LQSRPILRVIFPIVALLSLYCDLSDGRFIAPMVALLLCG
jgi:hypothetical protein